MGWKILNYIDKDYEFDFDIVSEGNEVHLQDMDGFKFLSIKLNKEDKILLDKGAAAEVLKRLKNSIEYEFRQYQLENVAQREEMNIQPKIWKKLSFYYSKVNDLKRQLETCDESEKESINDEIEKIEKMIAALIEFEKRNGG